MRGLLTGRHRLLALVIVMSAMALIAGYAFAQVSPPASTAAPAPASTAKPAATPVPVTTSTPAAAPAPAAVAEAPARQSVKGVLTGNGVNVRRGPGTEHPVFYSAPLGTEVDVIAQQGEWYEIEFPIKGFSWITKEFFQKIDDKTGIVTGNAVSVRGGPGQVYDRLYVVPSGYKFQILGTDQKAEWFKVAPMPGETAWILAQYVRLSGPLPGAQVAVKPPVLATTTTVTAATVAPVATTTVVPVTTEAPAKTTETPQPVEPVVPKIDTMAEKFAQTEKSFDAEIDKENPLDWNLSSLETSYAEIAEKSSSRVTANVARQRLIQLKYYKNVQDRFKERGKIDEELANRLKELERQRAEAITSIPEVVESPFTAIGVVEKFYIKGIGGATHKLVEGDTILYLLKSDVVDLSQSQGKRCGIKGKIVTIPKFSVRLIEVESAAPIEEPKPAAQ